MEQNYVTVSLCINSYIQRSFLSNALAYGRATHVMQNGNYLVTCEVDEVID